MAGIPLYPLYDTTYHAYRLSPLYHKDEPLLSEASLRTHAKRLKAQLKGDNVRGVHLTNVGPRNALQTTGPLEDCNWELFGDANQWVSYQMQAQNLDDPGLPSVDAESARGISIDLDYERVTYRALLLRDPHVTTSPEGFTSLPLLLVKMPAPLRAVVLEYLKHAFDAHVAPIQLPSTFLTSTLESYFRRLTASDSTQAISDVVGKLHVQLTFPGSTTLLKHVDIAIKNTDVSGFVAQGKVIPGAGATPFTAAVRSYLQKHLALDVANPKVQLAKVECKAFIISADGRVKIAPPAPPAQDESIDSDSPVRDTTPSELAVQDLYASLIREASSSGRFLPSDIADTPSSAKSAKSDRRKRPVSGSAPTRGKGNVKKHRLVPMRGDSDVDMEDVPHEPPPPYQERA